MNDSGPRFRVSPAALGRAEFLQRFGGVYEHSTWVAERLWSRGLGVADDSVAGMAHAMAAIVDAASPAERLQLIREHPDLAGRAALRGELSDASSAEQASAGIDQCTEEEFNKFQEFNKEYWSKFEFPFVMAVRGRDRGEILAAFARRLENSRDAEFAMAIREIHKIARLRLENLVDKHAD